MIFLLRSFTAQISGHPECFFSVVKDRKNLISSDEKFGAVTEYSQMTPGRHRQSRHTARTDLSLKSNESSL